MAKRLYRSQKAKMIAGVCGGIAEYFKVDPTLVRLAAAVLLAVETNVTFFAYLVAMIILPVSPRPHQPDVVDIDVAEAPRQDWSILGYVLIGLGVAIMAQRFIWPRLPVWALDISIWPFALILVGVYLLTRRGSNN